MKKLIKKNNIVLWAFFVCFIVLVLINRNYIHYKFYYFTLIASIAISLYFIPFKLVHILNRSDNKIWSILSLIIFYFSAGFIAFLSISENSRLEVICSILIVLNFIFCIGIYFINKKTNIKSKIFEHLLLQTILILYNIFLLQ